MKHVLFVCTHNAGRSQMAEAFFNRDAPEDIHASSAGQHPRRAGVWPNVVEAMREVGIDLADRRPQKLTVEMQLRADWAVTLACGGTCPYVPTTVEDWDIPDPADEPLETVRSIRDAIEVRVNDLLEQRTEAIRSDRTGHQLRLARILPGLAREFDGKRSPEEVRACADAVLAQYSDARIRSHVLTLAERQTRTCLRALVCDATAATT